MKCKWHVSSQIFGDKKHYIAQRVLDTDEVIHSGNVERFGKYTTERAEVEQLVQKLNAQEAS